MANESGNKSPEPSSRRSELLQAILAIALAIAAQSAARDGFQWLGLAGFVIAALLFVSSVGAIFRASLLDKPMPPDEEIDSAEAEAEPVVALDGTGKLNFLRRHWRLVTIAEIFSGDIPPVRVGIPDVGEPGDEESTEGSEKG